MRVLFLLSANGALFQTAVNAAALGLLKADILGAITDRRCRALDRAQASCPVATCLEHASFPDEAAFQNALLAEIRRAAPDLIVSQFHRLLHKDILAAFPDTVINMHESLLPGFVGFDALQRALQFGVRFAGATIHFVDDSKDLGPQIAQCALPVDPDESEASYRQRLFHEQTRMLLQTVSWFSERRVTREGRLVRIHGARYNGHPVNPALENFAVLPPEIFQSI